MKEIKRQLLKILVRGNDLDTIIMYLMNYHVFSNKDLDTPPYLLKKEYQELLLLGFSDKFLCLLYLLDYTTEEFLMEHKFNGKEITQFLKIFQNVNVKYKELYRKCNEDEGFADSLAVTCQGNVVTLLHKIDKGEI